MSLGCCHYVDKLAFYWTFKVECSTCQLCMANPLCWFLKRPIIEKLNNFNKIKIDYPDVSLSYALNPTTILSVEFSSFSEPPSTAFENFEDFENFENLEIFENFKNFENFENFEIC